MHVVESRCRGRKTLISNNQKYRKSYERALYEDTGAKSTAYALPTHGARLRNRPPPFSCPTMARSYPGSSRSRATRFSLIPKQHSPVELLIWSLRFGHLLCGCRYIVYLHVRCILCTSGRRKMAFVYYVGRTSERAVLHVYTCKHKGGRICTLNVIMITLEVK